MWLAEIVRDRYTPIDCICVQNQSKTCDSKADKESILRTHACFTNHSAQKFTCVYFNTMSAHLVTAIQDSGLAKVVHTDADPKGDDPAPEITPTGIVLKIDQDYAEFQLQTGTPGQDI